MACHIPFVNTTGDLNRWKTYYPDSEMVHISMDSFEMIPKKMPIWIDPGVDAYDHLLAGRRKWAELKGYLGQFEENGILADQSFLNQPEYERVKTFVISVLNKCHEFKPEWITIPQLPQTNDASRNKVNKGLAKATFEWKNNRRFKGKLILPLVFTHKDQLKGKTEWGKRIRVAKTYYEAAGADAVWAVDSSLSDQKGVGPNENRFQRLIRFHEDLQREFSAAIIIAGPYWGMNLILWARGLCNNPAICLGTAYQYYISGGFIREGYTRIAIPPLKRWAVIDILEWIEDSLRRLSPEDQAYNELTILKRKYNVLTNKEIAKNQISEFYKKWFDRIENTPPPGRALALYQDFSSAYVLGKQLTDLPQQERSARAPERVAQQFMLSCL